MHASQFSMQESQVYFSISKYLYLNKYLTLVTIQEGILKYKFHFMLNYIKDCILYNS